MQREGQRLSKILAQAGVASRRAAETLIFSGQVKVNGKIVIIPQTFVSLEHDEIVVNEKRIHATEKKVYYLLNKPSGYICSNKPVGNKRLVIDLFAAQGKRLFTVGRLDRDTTGLLIITNDGHFAHKVIHPSSNLVKEYLVKVSQEISHEHLLLITKGTWIEKSWIKPVRVTKVRKGTLKISVKEGKKREVRLLVENAGLQIESLCRIRIGNLTLGNLPVGSYREMSERERALFNFFQ
jgi:23S rRNA pseudouridine2605 synthase